MSFTKRKDNRYLADEREDLIRGGFRGTSWIEAGDLYAGLKECHLVMPEHITH